MTATLPTPRAGTSAIWDGENAYIFGGHDGSRYFADILRYDPATNTVQTMGARLPTPRTYTSAVWDGTYAYIFGGDRGEFARLADIVRYDPATDSIRVMDARLPTGRQNTAAVWSGTHAYVFGGMYVGTTLSEILRYDPVTDQVQILNVSLLTRNQAMSAVWDGSAAFLFGGYDGSSPLRQIVQFDPATNNVSVVSQLPTARATTIAAWDGTSAYVFGGQAPSSLNEIVRFTPGIGAVETLSQPLPSGLCCASAVWDGSNVYVFGGFDASYPGLNRILRFNPSGSPFSACFTLAKIGFLVTVNALCSTGNIITYAWDWSDGSLASSGITASHTYQNRGNYRVTLTASDSTGSDNYSLQIRVGPTDDELALHYAPMFLHDTARDDDGDYSADEIARIDFDGDWEAENNWENEPFQPHPAIVYYWLWETETHYHIGYAAFHPRDWLVNPGVPEALCAENEHENDMEGVLVLARKDSIAAPDGSGRFVALHALAHDVIFTYVDMEDPQSSSALPAFLHEIRGDISFWPEGPGQNAILGIQSGGHGILGPTDVRQVGTCTIGPVWEGDNFPGGDGNTYWPGTISDVPGNGVPAESCSQAIPAIGCRGNDRSISYSLLPIRNVWDRRFESSTFPTYGSFGGDDAAGCGEHPLVTCAADAAKTPWAWREREAAIPPTGQMTGDFFDNPANFNLAFLNAASIQPFSSTYVSRSEPSPAESFHGSAGGAQSRSWTWRIPGAAQIAVSFSRIDMQAGSRLEVHDSSGTTIWSASTGQQGPLSVCVPNADALSISFTSTGEDWGFSTDTLRTPCPN